MLTRASEALECGDVNKTLTFLSLFSFDTTTNLMRKQREDKYDCKGNQKLDHFRVKVTQKGQSMLIPPTMRHYSRPNNRPRSKSEASQENLIRIERPQT